MIIKRCGKALGGLGGLASYVPCLYVSLDGELLALCEQWGCKLFCGFAVVFDVDLPSSSSPFPTSLRIQTSPRTAMTSASGYADGVGS